MTCGNVISANRKWRTFCHKVRALRKPMIQMIFQNCPMQVRIANSEEQRGSRECINSAFADSLLAAKRDRPALMSGAD